MDAYNKETQSQVTPDKALEILKEGNQRFANGKMLARDLHKQVTQTSQGQYPFAVILECIDSRTSSQLVFDQGIGDVFGVRIAGNTVNNDILGSIEYGCKVAGAKLVVVMGHKGCGAVKGACDSVELGHITKLVDKIKPALEKTEEQGDKSSANSDFVNRVAKKNIECSVENIKKQSPILNEMYENKEIDIVGAFYDVETGKVSFM